MPSPQHCCQTCGADNLHEIAGFQHLPRATSDSMPYRQGGRLFVCERCEVLARRLLESGVLPRSGTLLDVGAGSGAMLGAFSDDEDPARNGRLHLGRPILRPEQVPPGAVVYLAFVREVSNAISRRLAELPVRFAAPPAQAA
jgi:hypothetical protein